MVHSLELGCHVLKPVVQVLDSFLQILALVLLFIVQLNVFFDLFPVLVGGLLDSLLQILFREFQLPLMARSHLLIVVQLMIQTCDGLRVLQLLQACLLDLLVLLFFFLGTQLRNQLPNVLEDLHILFHLFGMELLLLHRHVGHGEWCKRVHITLEVRGGRIGEVFVQETGLAHSRVIRYIC